MGKWSPYSEEWENAHLQKVALDLFDVVQKQQRALAEKTPIQRLLIKLMERLRFLLSKVRFHIVMWRQPDIKKVLDERKSAGNIVAVKVTIDEDGHHVATVLPSDKETPRSL